MPKMPKITARKPRIVLNVAALTNMVYTGINVAQDVFQYHRFTQDDKVFVASFLVGLVSLVATFSGVQVDGEQSGPVTVNVEPGQNVKLN